MKVNLNEKDLKEFKNLLKIKDKNVNIADLLLTAFYYADFINIDFINEQIKEGESEEDAIIENIIQNFSDDNDSKDIKNHIELKCLNKEDFQNDYVKKLSNKFASFHDYKLKTLEYQPYQLFAYDDIDIKDNIEISKVGYFKEKFSYLALSEKKNVWMSVNPNEITTMKPFIEEASGNVLVLGLGMGYIAYMLSNKENVKSIRIVEKNKDNIILFKKFIAPIFDNIKKIEIIQDDAINFVKSFHRYDYIFADLWFTPEDGLEYYLKLNKIEKEKHIKIHYWLNDSLKQMKRRYLIELINESLMGYNDENYVSSETLEDRIFKELYFSTKNLTINSFEDIKELLK